MTRDELHEALSEYDGEILLADGFEDAFIGIAERCGAEPCAVYDFERAVQVLVERDGLSEEDAYEHLTFNVTGAYVGASTPWFIVWRVPTATPA